VIDRSKENEVVDVLSSNGEGPRIFGRFANGRLESWLLGQSLQPAQMREPKLSALIAGRLSRLHRQRMPFDRSPVIAKVLRKWASIAADVSFPSDAAKAEQLAQLNLPAVIVATEHYVTDVHASYFGGASPVVFAHNDLLSGNVMYDAARETVALVDFEYGNFNPRGFDFANHFCECCGFECDWSVFPTFEAQQHFLRSYLAAAGGVQPALVSTDAVNAAYAEVQCWLLAPHLFWCLWAVVQARYSPIEFDYLSYAHQRWRAFNDMKAHTDRWTHVNSRTLDEAIDEERKRSSKA
jgi:ethanolamine kinase